MHFFLLSLLLNSVSNAVFATTKETTQLSTSMRVPEGANVTLNCTFNQSVICRWTRNTNMFCIDADRYRFVYEMRNEKPCNKTSNYCGDCSSWFQYNECSIHLLNYTNNVDSAKYECIGVPPESPTFEGIGGHTFQLLTAISNNNLKSTNETTNNNNNNNLMYVYVAVGCVLSILIVAVIAGVCVVKRKTKTEVSSDSENKNESSSVNVTLDTSGLSEEALVLMRKPQPNPRGLGPKRKSASTGCINPYAETHFLPPPPLHASNTALTSGYSEQECCYSNLYDDVAVNRNHLHEIVPPSSTQYDVNHYAIPDINHAILPKVPPNSEVVYAEIVLTHKSRRNKHLQNNF